MRKLRLYLDTSVIGGYFDPEFEEATKRLFEYIRLGVYQMNISDVTMQEINAIPIQFRNKFEELLADHQHQFLNETFESISLIEKYVASGTISSKHLEDARHVAIATCNNLDFIISWNFKHLVNIRKIRGFHAVNLINGYNAVDIRTPLEVISYV